MRSFRCLLGIHKWEYAKAFTTRMRGCITCGKREWQQTTLTTDYWDFIDNSWKSTKEEMKVTPRGWKLET